MKLLKYLIIFVLCASSISSHAQRTFTRLDELLDFAKQKSISIQQGNIKMNQAQKAKLAAVLGIIDPLVNNSFSITDNLKQQVNLFPAETFGGAAGTFKEITLGTKYVNNLTNSIDLKLLNLGGWENLKLAKLTIESITSDNKMTEKLLYENIASSYYNSVNLQEQIKSNQQNLASAETLLQIAQNKYTQGIAKQQDVNDAKASVLTTQENIRQLIFLEKQYELSLKILCDIPENEDIAIEQALEIQPIAQKPTITFNDLNVNNSLLKEQYALANYNQTIKSQLPTVSLMFSNANQQNSTNFDLFNGDTRWINSNYIGLKLSVPLPSANTVSQKYKAKYDYELARKNTEHIKIKSGLEHQQLGLDFDKSLSQAQNNQEIYALRKDSYEKNKNLYAEGLMSMDQTINSYNAMVNSNYNLITAQINVLLAQAKIDINNLIR